MVKHTDNEERYPHAADVYERYAAENGFAGGWAPHQKPVPEYLFDCHIHYCGPDDDGAAARIRSAAAVWDEWSAARAMLIFKINGAAAVPRAVAGASAADGDSVDTSTITIPGDSGAINPSVIAGASATTGDVWISRFTAESAGALMSGFTDENRCFWSAWLDHGEPNPEIVRSAAAAGARGIKLHNAPVIENNAPYDIWLSGVWGETFGTIGELGLPVLFHVTQRLPGSAYTGGGRETYWKKGWENGVKYGNEELLQAFLECCRRHGNVTFIGAHQLHIGWDRLDRLFAELPNLCVDTTVGCSLRLCDSFYPHDKEYLRDVFIKWADRIIFGTDCFWGGEKDPDPKILRQHTRFITSLDLPDGVLQKICHGNMERIYGIDRL
jgi:predicted TIM-barrel fold metal-dependent hydrolase